tara:strand:+ start:561 stop:1358 length:798 start_codon:yes stop_codon:yes gene_type:complete
MSCLNTIFRRVLLLGLIGYGFSNARADTTYERFGIMSALDSELRLLLSQATVHQTITIGNVDYHLATLQSRDVVLVQAGGYGILPSASTSILIHELGVDAIIFTGIAGGVAEETKVMDVVVSKDLVIHDCGTETNNGFVWKPDCGVHSDGSIPADKNLRQASVDAARQVVGDNHVFEGTIASGEAFIASESYVRFLRSKFNAYAVESEGGPVARVAYEFNVPVVVIRTLSDLADGNATQSFTKFADKAADNSAQVVMEILKKAGS